MHASSEKITILVDNQAAAGLVAEHGFSLWIDTGDQRILFDTGQGPALPENARVLGIGLHQADVLVLSHGHYDHTGGIPWVLQHDQKVHVYCRSGAVQPRYAIRCGMARPIQMPREAMAAIDRLPIKRLHWVSHAMPLAEKIGITGIIPRETSYEDAGGPFYLDPWGRRPDPVDDDLALWIRTNDGLIVCVGCCHAGLVNTLNYITAVTHERRIHALIGGFHLANAGKDRLERTARALQAMDIHRLIPCHCTGDAAVAYFKQHLACPVQPGYAGFAVNVND